MSDQLKNIFIGLFVTAAIAITIAIIIFLEPKVGDGKEILHVRFTNISGVNIGTRVNIAGKPIGELVDINVIPKTRQERTDALGRVYFYELTLKVDSSVKVYSSDEIAIQTTGLLGEKTINIIPKLPKKGEKSTLINDEIIYGDAIEPFENAIVQISEVADAAKGAIGNFDMWFMENYDQLSQAISSFGSAMKSLDITIDDANKQQLVASAKLAIDSFTQNMTLIEGALQEAKDKEMVAKINTLIEHAADASASISTITKDIADGKGTIGKLVSSEDFYLRLSAIMSKADTLMNDINHYGLLFQYNKHWQRIRTKRATLIQALNTPKQFEDYFEKELDSITCSLERITMLLDRAKDTRARKRIMRSDCFKKDFASLMRQTEDLLDTLKKYNEELETPECP